MFYKYILNIEEITYISKFKINIFYFISTLLYKYIHHTIFKSIVCTQSTLLLVISKMVYFIDFILYISSI